MDQYSYQEKDIYYCNTAGVYSKKKLIFLSEWYFMIDITEQQEISKISIKKYRNKKSVSKRPITRKKAMFVGGNASLSNRHSLELACRMEQDGKNMNEIFSYE